jgi:exosortase
VGYRILGRTARDAAAAIGKKPSRGSIFGQRPSYHGGPDPGCAGTLADWMGPPVFIWEGVLSRLSEERYASMPAVRAPASQATQPLDVGQLRWILIGGTVILALLLWVFWHFFNAQFRAAIKQQADWGHTLVIPLIAGYLVYLNREKLLAKPFKTTWIGLVPIVLGTAWYMFCWLGPVTLRHHNLLGAGVSLTIFGLVLLFCGFRATVSLLVPLLYLCIFGQRVSDKLMTYVTFPLQDVAARGSWLVLNLIGVDTDRVGNILTVWDDGEAKNLNIAEACSGMRMLMAFMALGVAMAYIGFKRWWQRVTLVLLGVPTAIAVNILRVATLGVLMLFDTDFAAGDFHTFIGLLWLVPALLIYLGIMWILRHIAVEAPQTANAAGGDPADE